MKFPEVFEQYGGCGLPPDQELHCGGKTSSVLKERNTRVEGTHSSSEPTGRDWPRREDHMLPPGLRCREQHPASLYRCELGKETKVEKVKRKDMACTIVPLGGVFMAV